MAQPLTFCVESGPGTLNCRAFHKEGRRRIFRRLFLFLFPENVIPVHATDGLASPTIWREAGYAAGKQR